MIQFSPRSLAITLVCLVFSSAPTIAQSWQDISANVPGVMSQEQFANMASDGTRLYVLGDKGVFVSADNGNSFTAINAVSGGGPDLGQLTLRFIKYVNGEVWVGGGGFVGSGLPAAPRLHRLTPGETVWQPSAGGLPGTISEGSEDDLTYDPVSGNYFGTISTGTVYVSTDGGINWEPRTNGLGGIGSPSSIVPVNGVVLTSRPLAGVLKTTDQGLTWSGSQSFGQDSIGNMIERNGRLLIVAGRTMHFSDDAGDSWHQVGNVPHGNSVLSGDGENLYAVSRNNTVPEALAYSASGGLTWHDLPREGLPPIPSFAGYYVFKLLRHGDFLFLRGITLNGSFMMESTQLHRLDISAFEFINDFQIAVHPQDKQMIVGDSYQLSVYAGGENLTYQWRRNGENLPGKNERTLLLPDVSAANAGDYTVIVMSGALPPLTSDVAEIEVFEREEGRIDPTFDTSGLSYGGQVFLNPDGTGIGVSRNSLNRGRIYSIGANGGRTKEEDLGTTVLYGRNLMDNQGRLFLTGGSIDRILQSNLLGDPAFTRMTKTGDINAVAELPGQGYLVGGTITVVNGSTVNRIALISYDRVINPDFPVGEGPNGAITHITVAQDGGIYVAGAFSTWSGLTAVNGLVKLDANGNASTVAAANAQINYVNAINDGRLLAKLGNVLIAIKADGTPDTDFNTGNHTITTINGAVQQPDGKIVIAGDFTSFAGQSVARYVRVNSDGSLDDTFFSAEGFSNNEPITGVAYDPRGYLYLAATATGNRSFQGTSVGRGGPIRIFAGLAGDPEPGTGFADWPALATVPDNLRGPNDKPANDNVDNLIKYAIGVNPLDATYGRLPQEIVKGSGADEGYPVVSYVRAKNQPGIGIGLQVSTSPNFDVELGSTVIGLVNLGDGTERVSVRSNVTFASQPSQFFRLQVLEL